jgi:hypothetical protein
MSCTNFAASINETALFGNSEDGGMDHYLANEPLSSQVFYYPAAPDGYGCVFVGWLQGISRAVQGGMNDQGLCYDLTGIPSAPMNPHPEKPYTIGGNWIQRDILRQNANVSEAIDFLNNVYWEGPVWYQWFFADKSGDMVIVSPGTDGELAFTRKMPGEDGFLTQTNFNRATNESELGIFQCWRYKASTQLLNEIKNEEDLTNDAFKSVLEAVHFNKGSCFTGYSNAFDPNNQMLYLNLLGQFDETAIINATEELATPIDRVIPMTEYFTQDTIDEGLSYFKSFKTRVIIVYRILPLTGIVAIIAGITTAIVFTIRKRKKKKKQNSLENSTKNL